MDRLKGIALAALGIAILVPHLVELGYHPFSFEVIFWVLAMGGVSFVIGWACPWLSFVGIAGFYSYWLFDSFFITADYTNWLAMGVAGFFVVMACLQRTILPLVIIAFSAVFTLPSLFDFPSPALVPVETSWTNENKTKADVAYLHLILDEQMSLDSLPETLNDAEYRDKFYKDYVDAGFKVNTLAMANSSNTYRSVSAIFAFTDGLENYKRKKNHKYSFIMKENKLVPKLNDMGFNVSIIESNYLELCHPNAAMSCETFSRAANMNVMSRLGWDLVKRIKISALALHQDYFFYEHKVKPYRVFLEKIFKELDAEEPTSFGFFSRPLVNLDIMADLAKRTEKLQPGDALIAHLMLPHFPFILDETCNTKDIDDWTYPIRHDRQGDFDEAYKGFWDQTRCTHEMLQPILKTIAARDDLIVIVHGDHGSRIAHDTDQQSDLDTLSTFLAIKTPETSAELLTDLIPLQPALIDFYSQEFGVEN